MCQHQRTPGKQLRVGDTIEVWWANGRDTITGLRPYHGLLSPLWDKYGGGAKLADFALNKTGMTIEPQIIFAVLHPSEHHNQNH